jgi:ABC-type glutathione transport system ATPase component
MALPFITVNNLCMEFDGTRVLNGISFEIPEGEIIGVIGRSGSGKSVLMHLLRGVEQPPTRGSVIYHVSACDTCEFMDVQSRAEGSTCSAENWSHRTRISGTRIIIGYSPVSGSGPRSCSSVRSPSMETIG